MKTIHSNRIDYLMRSRTFLDIYCALTVPDNVPFNPKDYEEEAQQFIDDNLYSENVRQRLIEKQYKKMLGQL